MLLVGNDIPSLLDLGISKMESSRMQAEAGVPDAVFEQHITALKTRGEELTSGGVYRLAQKIKQAQERENTRRNRFAMTIPSVYRVIVIDPPWPMQKILREAAPMQDIMDYLTMTVEEITKLPIVELADPLGCHIYLWTTHKFLPTSFELFAHWGVKYECLMTWRKNVGFTPFSWMYDTEHVLFGRIGSLSLERKGLRLSFEAKVTKH